MHINPDKLRERLEELGTDWADKKAAAESFEETKKVMLARLMKASDESTAAGKEREALASQDYEEHIKIMINARKEADKAKVRYECAKVYIEMLRSLESTKRAEMQLQ